MELYNDDCFNVFPKIKEKSINLFVLDLPYGQTACKWDSVIDLNEMWKHIKRIMKPNAVIIFFTTAKFGYSLIHSNPKWFRYDLVWEKSRKVGFLSANKMPLRKHELMYVFSKENNDDIEITDRNKELKEYAKKVKDYINESLKIIDEKIGNLGIHRFFNIKNSQFCIPNKKNYEKLTELYNLTEMEDYLNYEELQSKWKEENEMTYNSQKTEGKPYKTKGGEIESYYREEGVKYKINGIENKGTRHPHSILQFSEDHENIYIFSKDNNDDIEIERNKELREYANKILNYTGKTKKEIIKKLGQGLDHFFRIKSCQFSIPIKKNYEKLTELYKLNEMEDYLNYEELESKWKEENETTYNSQKTEGKPYKTKGRKKGNMVYGSVEGEPIENKGERHPSTILKFNNPKKSLHRTQKPTDLLEWLIKSYSNEGETIMDFTMGSGSTGEACLNTNRRFIGIEKDEDIFTIAKERLKTI